MNEDQIKGRVRQGGGVAKQIVGKLLGDPALELEGRIQQATGRAQRHYGDLRNDLGAWKRRNNGMRPQ